MSEFLKKISVVIPFTSEDLLWKDLLQDLLPLGKDAEILLVGPDTPDIEILNKASQNLIAPVRYVYSPRGRAVQLNTGARAAEGENFWFLHADSKVPRPSIYLLEKEFSHKPGVLHYFDLQFLDDGPRLVGLNSIGANWRSRYLGMPFGNQGFALSRATFVHIGGFDESLRKGEDHAFVWEARRKRIPLNPISACIFTSARKYEALGWSRATRKRVINTALQATSEYFKLVKQRVIESI